MDKRIIICIVIILIFAVLAVMFFHYFEIVPKKTYIQPIQDYYRNGYLALERWLNASGIPARTDWWFSLNDNVNIQENTVIIFEQDSYYLDTLNDKKKENLTRWISNGKNLIICFYNINKNIYYDEENSDTGENELINFLSELGIEIGITPDYYNYTNDDMPDLHWKIKFDIKDEQNDYFTVRDKHDNIRIVRIEIGSGSLTVLGNPLFMRNAFLKEEKNALLTWKLIGEKADNTGVLLIQEFIERKTQKPLFGTLMQRGNIIPVLISAIILIIFGFWSVIPVFGLLKDERIRNSRPIKDRFMAEISFLKKYKGLYYYDDAISKLKGGNNEKN